jgi:hypothetical protein
MFRTRAKIAENLGAGIVRVSGVPQPEDFRDPVQGDDVDDLLRIKPV